jgi:2'-5' RNA ligase
MAMEVSEVVVYRSQLERSGAVYTVLGRVALAGKESSR